MLTDPKIIVFAQKSNFLLPFEFSTLVYTKLSSFLHWCIQNYQVIKMIKVLNKVFTLKNIVMSNEGGKVVSPTHRPPLLPDISTDTEI
jgi:hypothetical protein